MKKRPKPKISRFLFGKFEKPVSLRVLLCFVVMSVMSIAAIASGHNSFSDQTDLSYEGNLATATEVTNQQGQNVTGTVTDMDGLTLPGVTVMVEGTTTGTITDIDGKYKITAPGPESALSFSYVGYIRQSIQIGGQAVINVTLLSDLLALDEIVVVGYGTQRAGNITGSISRVNADDLAKVSTPTIAQSLQGQAAGVFIKSANAQPGENKTQINIRGFGTPLFIVDGMPVSERFFQELDPNDIEELNVLKDAASAAVYGARAGNGVIIVRTKRGGISEPQFSFKSEAIAQYILPTAIPKVVNSAEWMELDNFIRSNRGQALRFTRELIDNHWEHIDGSEPELYPNVNIYEHVLKDYSPMTQNSLSVRGGTENVSYFFSGNYMDQRGMLVSDDIQFKRYGLRSNVDVRLNEKLSVGLDFSITLRDYTGPRNQLEGEGWGEGQGIMARMRRWRPFFSVEPLPNPELPRGAPGGPTINPINATYIKNVGYLQWEGLYSDAKVNLEYRLLPELKTRVVLNYFRDDYRWNEYQKRGPEYYYNQTTGNHDIVRYINARNQLTREDHLRDNVNLQYFLEYNKTFSDNHNFGGLLVAEYLTERFDRFDAWRLDYDVDLPQLFAGPATQQFNDSRAFEGGRVGYIGRISYNYRGKYNIEVNTRLDGSPRFPEEGRWGIFPSASASWNITEENFIRNSSSLNFLANLKLRASYGRLGFDRAGAFQYLATYRFAGSYIYSGEALQRGIRTDAIPNPNITWEKMDLANLGLDFSLWRGGLSGSVDIYQRDRTDVLGTRIREIPAEVGATLPQENYQEYQNRGWELMLNHTRSVGEVNYRVGTNLSYNREKTKYIDEPEFANMESFRTGSRIDQWTGRVWMYQTDGLFQTQEEIDNWADMDGRNNATRRVGDARVIDLNGDGRITGDDRIIVSSGTMPRITFAFNGAVSWKGFEVFMSWQGAGLYGYNLRRSEYGQPFQSDGAPLLYHRDDSYVPEGNEWRPANTSARWPRIDGNSFSNQYDIWWINGRYIRLRQLQLTYTVPPQVLSFAGIKNLRIFASAYNLLTFSELDFLDPEADTSPRQFLGNYHPQMGSFHLGIDLNF